MIIGIDGNEANVKMRVGVGQYAYNLLVGLNKSDHKNSYYIYLKNSPLPDLPPASANWQYRVIGPSRMWTLFALPFHLYFDNLKLDIFFSPNHYLPYISPFPAICSIMDLGFLHFSQQFTKKDLYQLTSWTNRAVHQASKIITISRFTKNEIISSYRVDPNLITIAYPGTSVPQNIPSKVIGIPSNYFLFLGTLKPSKNIPFLLTAFSQYLSTHPKTSTLVIAGKKGWLFNEIFTTVQRLKLEKNVIFTDYFTESQKWTLLKNARALIIPSLYEGFGIPAIEAMSVGTPVISSNAASLPEIIGNSGILIDPTNVDELSLALAEISKPSIHQKYSHRSFTQSKKYTWSNTVKAVLDTFDSLHHVK